MNTNAAVGGSGRGAERRRYVRVPIRLDALVAIDGRPPVPCSVRDFCVAGIFVALSPQQLRLTKPQMSATLYFSLVVDGVQNDYHLTLTIFRVVGSGFGCGFENADPQTIALLQSLAGSTSPSVPDSPEALSKTQSDFSARFGEVKEPLVDLVSKFARRASDEFLRMVDEALFLAARDAGNNVDETRFLDGQNEIRGRRDEVKELVPKLLGQGVEILNTPLGGLKEAPESPSLSELSLIDKDEFEEFLTVSQLVSELEPRFKDPLYELERRLSLLAKREVDERSNPLGPAVVCGVFAEALKNLQSERNAVNVIYRTLRKALEPNLDQLYKDVNAMLVEHDVLPVVEKGRSKITRHEGTHTREPPPPDALDASVGQQTGSLPPVDPAPAPHAPAQPGYGHGGAPQPAVHAAAPPRFATPPPQGAPTAGPAGGFEVIDPAVAGAVPPGTVVQSAVPHAPPGVSVAAAPPAEGGVPGSVAAAPPAGGTVAAAAPGGGVAAGVPMGMGLEATFGGFGGGPAVYVPPSLQQAYSAAQAQMALRRDLLPTSSSDAITVGSPELAYSPAQVIDGLNHLQRSFGDGLEATTLDVGGIKQRIIDAITAAGGDPGSIGPAESDAIEVIANLFEVLIEDALVADSAKAHLRRLQAPVHKAALLDPQFFETTDHPVRQLLNRISMLRDDFSETSGERVTGLVQQVNREFRDDVGVLRPIVDELDEILRVQRDAYNDRVASVVQASEEQERILSARRDKNLEATDSSIANAELPEEWNRWLDRGKLLEAGERMSHEREHEQAVARDARLGRARLQPVRVRRRERREIVHAHFAAGRDVPAPRRAETAAAG